MVSSINAIDRGTTTLPASLTAQLAAFIVSDYRLGSAYDIGRYEAGFLILATPHSLAMEPGGTVYFTLRLFPSDIRYDVTLSSKSPSPYLTVSLSPTVIDGTQVATLTVIDNHPGLLMPGEWYILTITGSGSLFTSTTSVNLLVGGARIYLPAIQR
jgi:hypothetical protein